MEHIESSPNRPAVISAADALAEARRWYVVQVEAITTSWEQRFRHRQYRPDEPDSGDWDVREAPRNELEHALIDLLLRRDNGVTASLVLAVSPNADAQYDRGATIVGNASTAMALDVLSSAEECGHFAEPCTDTLTFPDLPSFSGDGRSDEEIAAHEAQSARMLTRYVGELGGSAEAAERAAVAAEERLGGIRAGTIVAVTREQKIARHNDRRAGIVLAYKARLEAAGEDASWVEVPPSPYTAREDA